MKRGFMDSLKSLTNTFFNRRSVTNNYAFEASRLAPNTLRALYQTGIGNKIVRLKSGSALKDTVQCEREADQEYYDAVLARHVKQAARWMLGMGRGIIVLHEPGVRLSQPMREPPTAERLLISVFSGDMVTAGGVVTDLQKPRYYKPTAYMVRGESIHHSRVIDFTYVQPPELDAPLYQYGGISEFQLIYEQLIADGIVQAASPRILEKASTLFYKLAGFKDALASGDAEDMTQYITTLEDLRGIMSAGLMDKDDELEVVTQSISNLADADQITLRRLAMVTGIPLAILVGENVKGLNSTGDDERQIFQEMIEALEADYLFDPINELLRKLGLGGMKFKENQGESALNRVEYDGKALANAKILWEMGEDHTAYLEDKGVIPHDDFAEMFKDDEVDGQA